MPKQRKRCRKCDATYDQGQYRDHARGLYHVRELERRRSERTTDLRPELPYGASHEDLPELETT